MKITEQIMGAILYIRRRLSEPSSFVALAFCAQSVGIHIDNHDIQMWLTTLSIPIGALGFFISEGKSLIKQ